MTTNCRFEGWKTALFSYGDAWVNAMDCQFENNETGLHYNTNEPSPSDYSFTEIILRAIPRQSFWNVWESISHWIRRMYL